MKNTLQTLIEGKLKQNEAEHAALEAAKNAKANHIHKLLEGVYNEIKSALDEYEIPGKQWPQRFEEPKAVLDYLGNKYYPDHCAKFISGANDSFDIRVHDPVLNTFDFKALKKNNWDKKVIDINEINISASRVLECVAEVAAVLIEEGVWVKKNKLTPIDEPSSYPSTKGTN